MAIETKKLVEQGKALWQKMPPRRRLTVVGAAVATLALASYMTLRPQGEGWAVLFAGLGAEDAAKVLAELKAQNVPYRLEGGGGAVEVPESKVHELRITLAGAGLPRGGGIGFEVFDKQPFGTTSFVEQMNYRRALAGELARTIMSLESVNHARVHIALGERSLYRDADEPPTASVVVELRPGRTLGRAQVAGIVHLVASSVEGLRPERVTIVDESGRALWSGDSQQQGLDGDPAHEKERMLAARIQEIVERIVGKGHAEVIVTAEIDRTKSERTEETFDKDRPALRSEARTEDTNGPASASGGVSGARGNLPGAPAPSSSVGTDGRTHLQETRNYELNHTVNHTVSAPDTLKRLHVAILVDGKLDNGKMVARGDAELASIAKLAREAAGLDAARGDGIEIHSAVFAGGEPEAPAAPPPIWKRVPVAYAGAGAAALLLVLFAGAALAVRRGRSQRRPAHVVSLPMPVRARELEAALAQPGALDGSTAATELPQLPAARTREVVLAAVRADSVRAARVLAQWLGENDNAVAGERSQTL